MTIGLLPRTTGAPRTIGTVTIGALSFPFTFDLNLPTSRYLFDLADNGVTYEREASDALVRTLKTGDTFFDVGANCGWFSALASQLVGPTGSVIAFEPDADNRALLALNAPLAAVIPAAVSNNGDGVKLYVNLDNEGGHSLWPCGMHPFNSRTREAGNPTVTVPTVTLDQFAKFNPTAIKCDTEGAEWLVMDGARRVLADSILKLVILERNDGGLAALGHTFEQVADIMRGAGFTMESDSGTTNNVGNTIWTRPA